MASRPLGVPSLHAAVMKSNPMAAGTQRQRHGRTLPGVIQSGLGNRGGWHRQTSSGISRGRMRVVVVRPLGSLGSEPPGHFGRVRLQKRSSAALCCLVVSLLVVAAPFSPLPMGVVATGLSIAMPAWSAGDFWVYSMNETGLGSSLLVRTSVIGTETVKVGLLSVPSYHLQTTYDSPQSSTLAYSRDDWHRVSDLALIKETQSLYGPSAGVNETISIIYMPPSPLVWPLLPNGSWNSTTVVQWTDVVGGVGTTSQNYSSTVDVRAGPGTTYHVPAGTFDAIPLFQNVTSGALVLSSSVSYWSNSASNFVWRGSTFNGLSSNLSLVSWGHSGPPYDLLPWIAVLAGAAALLAGVAWFWRSRTKRERK